MCQNYDKLSLKTKIYFWNWDNPLSFEKKGDS